MVSLRAWESVQPITLENVLFALKWTTIYFVYMFVSTKFLPGKKVKGNPTPQNTVLDYKINGLLLFIQTQLIFFLSKYYYGATLRPLITHFWSFFVAANIISFAVSIYLFITGRRSAEYHPHKQSWTPQWLNDFWFGATLNPRLAGVDLKLFFYQPSLIGLHLFLLAFGEYQYDTYGYLTLNMIVFQIFWWLYLFTHYIREDFMITTWDILAENFGFMLVWGDTVYLPFLYSIIGWFMADYRVEMKDPWMAALILLHAVSHYVFRSANWQKFDFKKYGQNTLIWGQPPKVTKGGLLISGWWGIGRHLNYTGEIITYLTFALCSGFESYIPYLLPLSLTFLLTHRAARDDKRCRAKYGEHWDEYCKIAKFKVFPFIY